MPILKNKFTARSERDRFREVIDLKKRKIHRLKKKGGVGGSSVVADCPVSLKEKYQ